VDISAFRLSENGDHIEVMQFGILAAFRFLVVQALAVNLLLVG